jgi:hypothetical protein
MKLQFKWPFISRNKTAAVTTTFVPTGAFSQLQQLRTKLSTSNEFCTDEHAVWTVIPAKKNRTDDKIIRPAILRSRVVDSDESNLALGPYIVAHESDKNTSFSVHNADESVIQQSLGFSQVLNDNVLSAIKQNISFVYHEAITNIASQDDVSQGQFVNSKKTVDKSSLPPAPQKSDVIPAIKAIPWQKRIN